MFVGLSALVFAAFALWWIFRDPDGARANAVTRAVVTPATVEQARVPPTQEHPAPQRELALDNIPVMAPGTADNSDTEPRHPHPITPAHERNFRQLNRVAQLNSLMDVGDVDELRQMNRKYREEYPEASLYQDGYDLIADCLESRTSNTRAAAERYWSTQLASNLRRYVRRYCLD
jgi:hypothetical protein